MAILVTFSLEQDERAGEFVGIGLPPSLQKMIIIPPIPMIIMLAITYSLPRNAYCYLSYNGGGNICALWPLPPWTYLA